MSRQGRNLIIKTFIVGPLQVNSYVVADPVAREAFIIDPGADPERIEKFIEKDGLDLKFIINTHGHGDHIAANGYFDVPIYIHEDDADFLHDPNKNLSSAFGFPIVSSSPSKLLKDGDKLAIGDMVLEILHTPGHTPGSICIKTDGVVFTGDTLFKDGVGRTDFEYGDDEALAISIRNKLLKLSDDTAIYPGHGDASTIGEERRNNPFLGDE